MIVVVVGGGDVVVVVVVVVFVFVVCGVFVVAAGIEPYIAVFSSSNVRDIFGLTTLLVLSLLAVILVLPFDS